MYVRPLSKRAKSAKKQKKQPRLAVCSMLKTFSARSHACAERDIKLKNTYRLAPKLLIHHPDTKYIGS